MKTPDISTIEKVLDNEATAEEAKWVVGWFKTEEGMKWLSERMDKDERQIQLGENRNGLIMKFLRPSCISALTNNCAGKPYAAGYSAPLPY